MDSALCFCEWDSLNSVHSSFVSEDIVTTGDIHAEDDFVETHFSGFFGGGEGHEVDGPVEGLEVAGVHFVEVGGEEEGFGAACAGTDFDDGGEVGEGVGGEEGGEDGFLGVFEGFGGCENVVGYHFGEFGVGGFHIVQLVKIL